MKSTKSTNYYYFLLSFNCVNMTTEPTPTSTLSQRMKQFEINKIQKSNSRSSTDGSFAEEDFQPRERVPLLPRYPPPKTTIAAVLLLFGGIIFVSLGLSILYTNLLSSGRKDRGLALIILGSLSKYHPPSLFFAPNYLLFSSAITWKLCLVYYLCELEKMAWI